MRIYKYHLVQDKTELPIGAEIIHFALQQRVPTIWCIVDPNADSEVREFRVQATGSAIGRNFTHLGTVIEHPTGGELVWHLFEVKDREGGDAI